MSTPIYDHLVRERVRAASVVRATSERETSLVARAKHFDLPTTQVA